MKKIKILIQVILFSFMCVSVTHSGFHGVETESPLFENPLNREYPDDRFLAVREFPPTLDYRENIKKSTQNQSNEEFFPWFSFKTLQPTAVSEEEKPQITRTVDCETGIVCYTTPNGISCLQLFTIVLIDIDNGPLNVIKKCYE